MRLLAIALEVPKYYGAVLAEPWSSTRGPPVSIGAGRAYLTAAATRIVLDGSDGSELHSGSFAVPAAVTTSGYGLIPTSIPGEYEMVHLAD